MNDVRLDNLDETFAYHAPNDEQRARYERLRAAFKTCAGVVLENCPSSADRSAALRTLRESMMTANASIATEHVV